MDILTCKGILDKSDYKFWRCKHPHLLTPEGDLTPLGDQSEELIKTCDPKGVKTPENLTSLQIKDKTRLNIGLKLS